MEFIPMEEDYMKVIANQLLVNNKLLERIWKILSKINDREERKFELQWWKYFN